MWNTLPSKHWLSMQLASKSDQLTLCVYLSQFLNTNACLCVIIHKIRINIMLCLLNSTVVDPRFQTRREVSDLFITNMYIFTHQDFSLYLSFSFLLSFLSLSSLIFFCFLSCIILTFFIFLLFSLFITFFSYSSPVFSFFHTYSLFFLH